GPPWRRTRPVTQLRVHEERTRLKIDLRIRRPVMQTRRNQPPLHTQNRLDEPSDPRRGIEVAHIRLHRTERTEPALRRRCTERLAQRGDLDGISERCPRPMRLDIADR